jgi:hypothetical protein
VNATDSQNEAGVQGLAPYFFEVEATVYVGEAGRTAARLCCAGPSTHKQQPPVSAETKLIDPVCGMGVLLALRLPASSAG